MIINHPETQLKLEKHKIMKHPPDTPVNTRGPGPSKEPENQEEWRSRETTQSVVLHS